MKTKEKFLWHTCKGLMYIRIFGYLFTLRNIKEYPFNKLENKIIKSYRIFGNWVDYFLN